MMIDLLKDSVKMDDDDFKSVAYLKTNSNIKVVVYLECAYFNAKLIVDDNVFEDEFNDREPYDRETHVFYVPEEMLTSGRKMIFAADDSIEDGDFCTKEIIFEPEFADIEQLFDEYDSRITAVEFEVENIDDGLIYRHMLCKDKYDAPVHMFMFEVDTKKASLYVGTADDGYETNAIAKVPEMIESAVANGQNVIAAMNADFFDMLGDNHPSGLCVKNGRVIANADVYRPFIGIKKDGTPVITSIDENENIVEELFQAAAGIDMLVKDGKICEWRELEPFSFIRHPRTAVGLKKDGTVILLEVDGRIPEYSNGATLLDLAKIMTDFGADRAINLDGGGSSVVYTKSGNEFVLRSNPADLIYPRDKLIRKEFNCLLVVKK